MTSRKWRLIACCSIIFSVLCNLTTSAYADPLPSNGSAMTNWFRRVSSSSADGSWLWGWAWGTDDTVSVVDRSPPVSFVSRPASFGKILEDAVNGYGIPMNAFTVRCNDSRKVNMMMEGTDANLGCPRLCPSGNHLPRAEESWIAIVQRGNCSFVAKARIFGRCRV